MPASVHRIHAKHGVVRFGVYGALVVEVAGVDIQSVQRLVTRAATR